MLDQSAYNEFMLERLKGEKSPEQLDLESFVNKMKKPVFLKEGPLKGLKKNFKNKYLSKHFEK